MLIGQAMGLPRLRLRALAQGAMLHDVGKLYISDLVLQKPDKLTPEEFEQIKQHPALGYELLMRLRGFHREALVVRHHHEWYDGSGYPDGLRGEEIPLEARIVAVADMYDALTTDRPYRRAYSHEEAMAIMAKETGSHLDPACVEAFRRAMEKSSVVALPSRPRDGDQRLAAS
ncbi:Cyclic di-GMP phosphodiesterase response regulator RpfG [bacterium HR24]|nr:Cyclic di-GMP phosphodiesterase response regulator RpfG [bacterium HR24]